WRYGGAPLRWRTLSPVSGGAGRRIVGGVLPRAGREQPQRNRGTAAGQSGATPPAVLADEVAPGRTGRAEALGTRRLDPVQSAWRCRRRQRYSHGPLGRVGRTVRYCRVVG